MRDSPAICGEAGMWILRNGLRPRSQRRPAPAGRRTILQRAAQAGRDCASPRSASIPGSGSPVASASTREAVASGCAALCEQASESRRRCPWGQPMTTRRRGGIGALARAQPTRPRSCRLVLRELRVEAPPGLAVLCTLRARRRTVPGPPSGRSDSRAPGGCGVVGRCRGARARGRRSPQMTGGPIRGLVPPTGPGTDRPDL